MSFEDIVLKVHKILPFLWLENEKYIKKEELHDRLLHVLGLPSEKQKNSKFCRLLKAAIHASTPCKEVTIKGYNKYKRL